MGMPAADEHEITGKGEALFHTLNLVGGTKLHQCDISVARHFKIAAP